MEVLLGIYLDHVSREEDMSLWGTLITHPPRLMVVLACFKCSVCTEEYGKTLDGEYMWSLLMQALIQVHRKFAKKTW